MSASKETISHPQLMADNKASKSVLSGKKQRGTTPARA